MSKINDFAKAVVDKSTAKVSTNFKSVNGYDVAASFNSAYKSPLSIQSQEGLVAQIAVINVIEHLTPLTPIHSWINSGELNFGEGELYWTAGYKSSTSADDLDLTKWVPDGEPQLLDKYQMQVTGFYTRKCRNDYRIDDLKIKVRNGDQLKALIGKEMGANGKTLAVEKREVGRYLFGIDNNILPADYKTVLDPIKNMLSNHVKTITGTTTHKKVVEWLRNFVKEITKNISNQWNIGSKTDGGKIYNSDGTVTTLDPLLNDWAKSDTVLVISDYFLNGLKAELGDTFHKSYWDDFLSEFGMVVSDTLPDKNTMWLLDRNAVKMKTMYEDFDSSYYYTNRTVNTLLMFRDHLQVLPLLNGLKLVFSELPAPTRAAATTQEGKEESGK